MTSDPYLLFA